MWHRLPAGETASMKATETNLFLDWARDNGIGFDPRFEPPQTLVYLDGENGSVRLCYPQSSAQIPWFIEGVLTAIDPWKECWAYRRSDDWRCPDADTPNGQVWTTIVRGLGIAEGDGFVVGFAKPEMDALITLVFATICFGWSVYDDIFIVPDHAQHILYFDHHDVVHVECRRRETIDMLVETLKRYGIEAAAISA